MGGELCEKERLYNGNQEHPCGSPTEQKIATIEAEVDMYDSIVICYDFATAVLSLVLRYQYTWATASVGSAALMYAAVCRGQTPPALDFGCCSGFGPNVWPGLWYGCKFVGIAAVNMYSWFTVSLLDQVLPYPLFVRDKVCRHFVCTWFESANCGLLCGKFSLTKYECAKCYARKLWWGWTFRM